MRTLLVALLAVAQLLLSGGLVFELLDLAAPRPAVARARACACASCEAEIAGGSCCCSRGEPEEASYVLEAECSGQKKEKLELRTLTFTLPVTSVPIGSLSLAYRSSGAPVVRLESAPIEGPVRVPRPRAA